MGRSRPNLTHFDRRKRPISLSPTILQILFPETPNCPAVWVTVPARISFMTPAQVGGKTPWLNSRSIRRKIFAHNRIAARKQDP